jgi:hypothetical protein
MNEQAVDMTTRLLSQAAKQSKTTVFFYFFTLYSAKAVGNDRAVGIVLTPSGRKRLLKKIIFCPFKKKKLKTGISFLPWRAFPASFSEIHRRKWLRRRMG